ncbi:unnamed protein product [Rhodiola kirilowii]
MEREAFYHDVPCSSIAVESAIRVGTAGAIWGLCSGPYDATKQGLSGLARASFVAKSIGGIGLQCDEFLHCWRSDRVSRCFQDTELEKCGSSSGSSVSFQCGCGLYQSALKHNFDSSTEAAISSSFHIRKIFIDEVKVMVCVMCPKSGVNE